MKKDIIKELLNLSYKSVIHPMNMLTIDNPDLLMLTERGLYGFFFPMQKELEHPDYLLRRVMASRLSYIGNLKTILFTEDEIQNIDNSILDQVFHHITYNDSIDDIAKLLRDKQFETKTREISKITKKATLDKFHKCMGVSEKMQTISKQYSRFILEKSHQNQVYSWACPNKKKNINDVYYDEDILLAFKGKTKSAFKESFENLITYIFMMDYQLQNGHILLNSNTYNLVKIVNTDYEIFNYNNADPYKYVRKLAYMGLSTVKINTKESLTQIREFAYGYNK